MRLVGRKCVSQSVPLRLLAVLALACFAWAQTAVAAHEAAYGSDIHFHDGQLCAISLHGDRHDDLMPPPALVFDVLFRTVSILRPGHAAARPAATVCTRRARAPPHRSSAA